MREWDKKSIPVIVGNTDGNEHIQIECRARSHPYLYIDHGYFTRGYVNNVFRMCLSHYHTTDWRESDKPVPKAQEWHKGSHIIVIPPAPYVQMIYGCKTWLRATLETLKQHTDRKVIVKEKGSGDLASLLPDAHCLVSYGSVAEVEAALHGVPVFTHCGPSDPIARTNLSEIETPIYPDREKWLSALAGAEFHLDRPDEVWQRIQTQIGD